jgi:anion-transporting  ArsA/GET3 family ATPase
MVRLVGMTYQWWERLGFAALGRKSLELYGRVEQMLGATLARQILDFFSIFRTIAEDYSRRARRTLESLRDPKVTTFTVVTTPFKARRDGEFFLDELSKRKFPVGSMVVNRVWPVLPELSATDATASLGNLISWYRDVSQSHQQICARTRADFSEKIPRLVAVPELSSDIDGLAALHQIAEQLNG